MKRTDPKFYIDFSDFMLEVYVIGYRVKGEAIVILFKENTRVFYSIVIDSYYKKHKKAITNCTEKILADNSVDIISMIVMSHPHEDHIKGMKELVDIHSNDETRFYYPARSFDIDSSTVKLKNNEKKLLKLVREKNKAKKTLSNCITVPDNYIPLRTLSLYDIDDTDEVSPLEIEINVLTPFSAINDDKAINTTLDPNDLSISILININEYYLFFGADTTNEHIMKLDRETLSGVKFVKIPHHASDTSNKLTQFFIQHQLDYACCTNYNVGSSHLPMTSVLKEYKNKARRVDVAGCASKDKKHGLYGELCYQFRLGPSGMRSSVNVDGVTEQI